MSKGKKVVCCMNCAKAMLHRYDNNPILAAEALFTLPKLQVKADQATTPAMSNAFPLPILSILVICINRDKSFNLVFFK